MSIISDKISGFRNVYRLNQKMNREIAKKHDLTQLAINILTFLHNNPSYDTAKDIVEIRGLSKGNVSAGIEELSGRGYLYIYQDPHDKRIKHLMIQDKAKDIIAEIDEAAIAIGNTLLSGFSEEEKRLYFEFDRRITSNAKRGLED